MFEVPAFGPFKKKVPSDTPESGKPFSEMDRAEREWAMRNQLWKSKYRETQADAGEGIIVGGESGTYPIKKTEALNAVQDNGILIGESEPDYSTEQKVGFMEGWSEDLSEIIRNIPGIYPARAGSSKYETSSGLLVEWDAEGVRPVWIHATGSGDSIRREEVRDFSEIAEAFTHSEIEHVFGAAKIVLEGIKAEEERKKNGPQPPMTK